MDVLDDWNPFEKGYMYNPGLCDCESNKASKINTLFDIKNCSCEKSLIRKLVLECKDEILKTTETLLNDKKVTYEKSSCFIHAIILVIICFLLLVAICFACYFSYK